MFSVKTTLAFCLLFITFGHHAQGTSEPMGYSQARELYRLLTGEGTSQQEKGERAVQLMSQYLSSLRRDTDLAFKSLYGKTILEFVDQIIDRKSHMVLTTLLTPIDDIWVDMVYKAVKSRPIDLFTLSDVLVQTWDERYAFILSDFEKKYGLTLLDQAIDSIEDEKLKMAVQMVYEIRKETSVHPQNETSYFKFLKKLLQGYKMEDDTFEKILMEMLKKSTPYSWRQIAIIFQLKAKVSFGDAISTKIKAPLASFISKFLLYAVQRDLFVAGTFIEVLTVQYKDSMKVLIYFTVYAEQDMTDVEELFDLFAEQKMEALMEKVEEPVKSAIMGLLTASRRQSSLMPIPESLDSMMFD